MCATTLQGQHCQEIAMRTLRILAEDMAESHLPAVLQQILPVVLSGMQSGRMTPAARRLGLAVLATCVKSQTLHLMVEAERKHWRGVVRPQVAPLAAALCSVLASPLPDDDPLCASTPPALRGRVLCAWCSRMPCSSQGTLHTRERAS